MPDDSRFDLLFEPVAIGPVTARNRFYQVPHCTGMGWLRPRMLAELRATKAEGGWGVVSTEWCSVHPSSDDLPYPNAKLWSAADIDAHALMTEKVHEHGSLAAVELWLGGTRPQNRFSREPGLSVASLPNAAGLPVQTRAMDKVDIANIRRWHRQAALRAKEADFDIVYVYATHDYLLSQFLSADTNQRSDEYGGNLENRVRLLRELIEDTREAVGDRCAVAVRFSAEQGRDKIGEPIIGEHRDMLGMLAELPDLWDINISDYHIEMGSSRFVTEGALESAMSYVKTLTSKPVVTVGRFTSPDTMLRTVVKGISDFIGAARPSIADPFLPEKIRTGRFNDIRECIGCNICYSGDGLGIPIHCTQNPTISEGWRRGWHPEHINKARRASSVLIVGAGPAGLEAARAMGQRGYRLMLAEKRKVLGGRVVDESALPGLAEWIRVRDYRVQQIGQMPNVEIYLDSEMTAADCVWAGVDHIVIASGATWRSDGSGRSNPSAVIAAAESVYTPDDIFCGRMPAGRIIVFDDDHYYHGSAIAEKLALAGNSVCLVTPAASVSAWSDYTAEQEQIHRRLRECNVELVMNTNVVRFASGIVTSECVYTGESTEIETDCIVTVTARAPNDVLFRELAQQELGTTTLTRIGDCDAPGLIADAVFAGHRYARELEEKAVAEVKVDQVFY